MTEHDYDLSTVTAAKVSADPSGNGNGHSEFTPASLLSRLQERVAEKVEQDYVVLRVDTRSPSREKYTALQYNPNFGQEDLDLWVKLAGGTSSKAPNQIRFCQVFILSTNTGIVIDGHLAEDEHGEPLKIGDPSVWEATGAGETRAGVRMFFGSDPHMYAHVKRVMEVAGFSEDGLIAEDQDDPFSGTTTHS